MEKKQSIGVSPLQTTAGIAVQGGALLVKNSAGVYYELNLEGLNTLFIPGESAWTVDVIDNRVATATLTAAIGAAVGTEYSADIAVPSGEVWIINMIATTAPANDATGRANWNCRFSNLTQLVAGTNKGILETNRICLASQTEYYRVATGFMDDEGALGTENLLRANGLGIDLRVVGPATIQPYMITTTAAFTAAYAVTMKLFGRKVHKVTA